MAEPDGEDPDEQPPTTTKTASARHIDFGIVESLP
jgi:hypothetical protein